MLGLGWRSGPMAAGLAVWLYHRFSLSCRDIEEMLAAREQLDQAEALFRDMGMDWWTAQAEGLRGRIDSGQAFVWFAP